jgi:hypothetical protein
MVISGGCSPTWSKGPRRKAMTDESLDDEIYRMRLLGNSPREIADHFSISIADVDAAVDGKMVKLDNAYRLRAVALDLERR